MKHEKITLVGIIIFVICSSIALAAAPITKEKEDVINQLLQQRASEVLGADNMVEYISIQEIGNAAQIKYNDIAKGYDIIKDETKIKIEQAQQRMLIAQPRIWTLTDSLKQTTQQKQQTTSGTSNKWWIILVIVLALGGGGTLFVRNRNKNKAETGMDPAETARNIIATTIDETKKADLTGIMEKINRKAQLVKENEQEIINVSQQLTEGVNAINGSETLKNAFYEEATDEKIFEKDVEKFSVPITPGIKLLFSIKKELTLKNTKLGQNLAEIDKLNEELSKTAEKNLKLDDEQIFYLKEVLKIQNSNIATIKDFDKRIESILRMERGKGITPEKVKISEEETKTMRTGIYERLPDEIAAIIKEDDKIGTAILELIKYYQNIRPHVLDLTKILELENQTIKSFEKNIKEKIDLKNLVRTQLTLNSRTGSTFKNIIFSRDSTIGRMSTLQKRMDVMKRQEQEAIKKLRENYEQLVKVIQTFKSIEQELKNAGIDAELTLKNIEGLEPMLRIMNEIEEQQKIIEIKVKTGKLSKERAAQLLTRLKGYSTRILSAISNKIPGKSKGEKPLVQEVEKGTKEIQQELNTTTELNIEEMLKELEPFIKQETEDPNAAINFIKKFKEVLESRKHLIDKIPTKEEKIEKIKNFSQNTLKHLQDLDWYKREKEMGKESKISTELNEAMRNAIK